ncbi:MAG: TIGR01620 family protein [Proteobacteria bacterium]|nr:TIGR01620 family protein [Pseudomonadota bacterium]
MTDKDKREPRAFVIEDDKVVETRTQSARKSRAAADIAFETAEPAGDLVVVPPSHSQTAARRAPWLTILLGALATLITMWAGLSVTSLIEDFFARAPWLGWAALAVASLAGFAAIAIVVREVWGLLRLRKIEDLQDKAARAINLDENSAAQAAVNGLTQLYAGRHDLALPMKELARHSADIMDPADRVRLAERILLPPLDEEAHRIIARRARRVTLLTTVTPAAALDILFVAAQNAAMLRELATLYGGKPSTLATLKLGRMVITHLAVTGGLALSDNLIQHVVGRGLLGRLSARFGEGAVNGILTCRIGLAAQDVCRPVPSREGNRETLAGLLRELVSFGKDKGDDTAQS